jgi:hypothetical protein
MFLVNFENFIFLLKIFFEFRVRDKFALINAMSVDPLYLQHKHAQKAVDYRVSRLFKYQNLYDFNIALGCCIKSSISFT